MITKFLRSLTLILSISLAFFSCPKVTFADPAPIKDADSATDQDISNTNTEGVSRDKPSGVITYPCPYTCNDAGFSHGGCKEWREEDTCFIGPKSENE